MRVLRQVLLKVIRLVVKPFFCTRKGKILGKLPLAGMLYRWLFRFSTSETNQPLFVNGYKMYLHTGDYKGFRDCMAQELLFEGIHEPYTTLLFKELVKERMTVVDIGANIGYFSLLAAGLVGDNGRVFSFEPEPQNYAVLVKNLEANGFKNATALCMAVSDITGKSQMFIDENDSGSHSLIKTRQHCTTTVDVTSLDDFFKRANCPVDVIKIDASGAEMNILSGMSEVIRANADLKIFIEFWLPGLESVGVTPHEYWDKLVQSGFKFIYFVDEVKQRLELVSAEAVIEYCRDTSSKTQTWANLLCTKSSVIA